MKNKNKNWDFAYKFTSLILLGSALAFNVVYADNFTDDKYEKVDNVRESGLLGDSFYTIDGEGFSTKIGLKGQDEDIVRFEAYPDKQMSGILSSAPDWLLGQSKGVEFELVEAIDSADLDGWVEDYKSQFNNDDSGSLLSNITNHIANAWENISSELSMFSTLGEEAADLELNEDQEVVNSDVISEVDLEYSALDKGVKEEIVVKASENVFDTYLFDFKLDDGVILHKSQSGNRHNLPVGTYYLADTDHNYIGHFLPLIAYDSNGVRTDDLTMDFVPVGGTTPPLQYVIAITVDKTWLSDPLLQYPVIIDPTIVHDTQGEFQTGEENRLQTTTDPRTELKYHELPADVNTVGLWHFDDSSGQTVTDDSGNGNDGTLGPTSGSETQDPTWNTTSQKLGDSALTFTDSENDYVKVSDTSNLKLTNEMTVEAWVKGAGASFVSTQRTSTSVNKYWPQMQVVGNKVYFVWDTNNGSSSVAEIWTASMNTDGTGWSATQRTSNSYIDRTPELQVVGNKIYYVFVQNDASNYPQIWTASMNTDGTSWSATKRTTTTTSKEFPQMQVYGSKIYYTYHENDGTDTEIWTASMNTDGTSWTTTRRTSNSNNDWRPRLFVTSDKIYYTWKYYTNPFQIMTAYSNIDGSGWTATQQTSAYINNDNPRMYVVDNKIYYVFVRSDGSYNQIWTATTNLDGTGWTLTQRTTTSYNKEEPEMQIVGNKIYYLWAENDGAVRQIWTAISNIDGANFTATKHTATTTNKTYPQFQIVGSKYYFVWQENISGNQIVTGYYGSNIINKGDFYGLGVDGNTVKGFANGGVDTMKYNASAVSYSNGAMAEGTIDSTNWHHVAATFDGASINTYIDGILSGSMANPMAISTNTASATDYPLMIGDAFNGLIDEVKVTGRALSSEEIYFDSQFRPYGVYTSDVIDLGVDNPTFNSLSWEEYGVRTGDGETLENDLSLVAQWDFNETSGTTAIDSSGNGHNGTLSGFSNTSGQDVTAISGWTSNNNRWGTGGIMMDGVDDYVTIPDNSDFDLIETTDKVSIESWINMRDWDSFSTFWYPIFDKYDSSDNGWVFMLNKDVSFYFLANATEASSCSVPFGDTDGWIYVAMTYDRAEGKVAFYKNGALTCENNFSADIVNTDSSLAYIGYNPSGSYSELSPGTYDSTRIYSRALTADEILSNYQAGQIELQTRTGTDDTPEDGGWEEWKPADSAVTTQLDPLDTQFSEYVVPTAPTDSPSSGLLTYWPMNETSGSNVDEVVNNRDGTAAGTDIVKGVYEKGRGFISSSSDYIQVPHSSTFDWGNNNYSISMFVRTANDGSTQQLIAKTGDSSHRIWIQLYSFSPGDSEIQCGWDQFSGMGVRKPELFDNRWHHIVCLRDSTTTGKIYFDGELATSVSGLPNNSVNNTSALTIGYSSLYGRYFDGKMDEVRIYNRALNSTEIEAMADQALDRLNAPISHTASGNVKSEGTYSQRFDVGGPLNDYYTLGLWHLDETEGSSDYLKDSSGNNYHATPSGTLAAGGFMDKSRQFNGSSDYINISSHLAGLEGSDRGTIEMWFKSTAGGPLFSITDKDTNNDLINLYLGNVTSNCDDESISYYLRRGGINQLGMFVREGHDKYLDGAWHHLVVATGDGDNRIFIDGEQKAIENCSIGSVSANEFTNINNPDSSYIGRYNSLGADLYHTGNIDEVRISDVARTSEEIAEAYRAGASHYLTRSLASASDLSSNNKLTYYVASDSPGTHINVTAGESPYANYQPDANTILLWHMDENTQDVLDYNLAGTTINAAEWKEIDANTKISQNNGIVLSAGSTAAWDSALISHGVYDRDSGKQIYAKFVTTSSVAPPNHMMIGWGQNQTASASYTQLTHGLYFNGGDFYVYQDGTSLGDTGYNYSASTTYEVRITLLESGSARYEIKGGAFTSWTTLLTADSVKTNEKLRVMIAQYRHTGTFKEIKVLNNNTAIDSSVYAHDGRVNGTDYTQGRIGGSRYFDGSSDYIELSNDSSFTYTGGYTVEAWVKPESTGSSMRIISNRNMENPDANCPGGGHTCVTYIFDINSSNQIQLITGNGTSLQFTIASESVPDNQWSHVVATYDTSYYSLYLNGNLVKKDTVVSHPYLDIDAADKIHIGNDMYGLVALSHYRGNIDELRISNTARTTEEIRQAYEIGKRTHNVTIDFGADLDGTIADETDLTFTVDATDRGLSTKGSNLFIGDKIIVRENYNGTEYIAQGTVDSVNQSTGAVTVTGWDGGGTFPSGGYTANADVFKWQKETFDIFGAMPSHVDAVDELSFRFLDGNTGRTFWIDDIGIVQNDGYLTDNTGSTITSTPNQYFQYKAILTTTDPDPTPGLGPITLDYEGDLSMTAASTSQSYMNTNNNTAFNVQCNGVTSSSSGNTVTCYASWNQINWYAVNTATSPLSNATIWGTPDVSGWTGYPLGNGTYSIYARAEENSNYTDTFNFSIEKDMSRPAVTAITSVAGDSSSPYYDTTDDSSTLVVYTADTDAVTCKWDESDVTYGAMADTCESTTNCTLDLSGEESKTVYFRCVDTAGNYSDTSYQLDYTIDATPPLVTSITSVAGDTSIPYKDNTDNGSTAVVYTASADAISCKWDEVDQTYGTMSNTCTDTSNCDLDLTGEGTKTVYMRCLDAAGLMSTSSYTLNYSIDTTPPTINSITSVAGDASSPYYDTSDDSSTHILFDVSADANECKWDTSDIAYDSMANTCSAAGDCTANLSGDGSKTVYIRCKDDIDNKATSSYQVDYMIDTTPPAVSSITSVAGDASSPYKDNTDNGSTAVVYVASGDAVSCKWDESDATYGAMANTCTDTSNCDLDLTGEGVHTVYMRCLDAAGLASTSSYQLDYSIDITPPTINSITSVAGDASSPYYDTSDDSSTQILFDVSADANECKWDTSDVAYDSMSNTCSAAGDCTTNLSGDGAKTVYIRCKDDVENKMTSSYQVDYTVDSTPPVVSSITSVAGDTSSPYNDGTDNGSTAVVYTASADAVSCKWDEVDQTYGTMANTCSDTSNCDLDLTGEGAHTVYMRCIDAAGLASTSSYTLNYNIDTTPPAINSITSVAGDSSAPYKDGTDDSSTLVVFSADADATECKWNTTDVAYDSMANTCTSNSNCTLNLAGDGSKTVYMRCSDEAGNKATSSYQLDYEIDSAAPVISSIISVAGDTSSPYYDTTDNNSTQILFNVSADATACKWSTIDQAYDSMPNTCSSPGDCTGNLSGQGAKTVYIRCTDDIGNKMTSSRQVDYTIDSIPPSVSAVTSVAGDPEAPYLDIDNIGEALIVYTASADAVTCKWHPIDVAYDTMSGTCESTTNCTVTHNSDGAKTVFMRCADAAGNKSTNSFQVDYDVDEQTGGGGTTSLLETSAPGASGLISITLTPDFTVPAVNGSVKIRFSDDYNLSGLTEDDVYATCGDVTFTNTEIIYQNGVKINKAYENWWNIFQKALAAGENSVVFPFTGSLDNSDGQCTFNINNATNPAGVGPQHVVYGIFSSSNGTGNPLEEGDGVVHINYRVIVTAHIESQLTFNINPVSSGQLVNGETTNISTTAGLIDFGIFTTNDERIGAHDLVVSTNATDGYVTTIEFDQSLSSASNYIHDFPATNATPTTWTTPPGSGINGYFGYTTSDTTLLSTPVDRFASSKWAGFSLYPFEIAYDAGPVVDQTTRVGYRLDLLNGQELGTYTTQVRYICTATY